MARAVRVLILGSKEYPFGTNRGDDPIPSGGMETYVDDLVPELSRLCEVRIITRKFRGTKKHEKKGNIEVFRVPWAKGKWLRNPSFNFMSLLKGVTLARGSDIIYTNGIISGFVALVLARMLGRKAVYRPAGIGFGQFRFPLKQVLFALERVVFEKSDGVVFHSEGERGNARKHFKLARNSFVILTGFPLDKFLSRDTSMCKTLGPKDETVITSVSRFVPVKGIRFLLEACSRMKGFRLLLVGSGPEEKALKAEAERLGLGKKVVFMGFRRDVPRILAASDVFVVSSLSEGLPTSLLEAMAARKACVVTDIGLPVEHMKTGIVVPPRDSKRLRDALERLSKDGKLRERLGGGARRFVERNCTQKKAARAHLEAFEKILGEKAGG